MDGWIGGWVDGWMSGWVDGHCTRVSCGMLGKSPTLSWLQSPHLEYEELELIIFSRICSSLFSSKHR